MDYLDRTHLIISAIHDFISGNRNTKPSFINRSGLIWGLFRSKEEASPRTNLRINSGTVNNEGRFNDFINRALAILFTFAHCLKRSKIASIRGLQGCYWEWEGEAVKGGCFGALAMTGDKMRRGDWAKRRGNDSFNNLQIRQFFCATVSFIVY